MKAKRRMLIALLFCVALGGVIAALYGRAPSAWFSRYTVVPVLLSVGYFFGVELAENALQRFWTSFFTFAAPTLLLAVIIDEKYIFGYTKEHLVGGAFVFVLALFVACLLANHSEPLRSALGCSVVPAFIAAGAVNRLIYFEQREHSWMNLSQNDCRLVAFLIVLAIVVYFVANREHLLRGEPYLALIIWGALFAFLIFGGRKLGLPHIPILF